MSLFYGILSAIGWIWCAAVLAYIERDLVRRRLG
jgi:hypothetical protein